MNIHTEACKNEYLVGYFEIRVKRLGGQPIVHGQVIGDGRVVMQKGVNVLNSGLLCVINCPQYPCKIASSLSSHDRFDCT